MDPQANGDARPRAELSALVSASLNTSHAVRASFLAVVGGMVQWLGRRPLAVGLFRTYT